MSTFCGGTGTIPSMTPGELRESFKGGILPSQIPSPEMDMTDGMASEKWVMNYVKKLEDDNIFPRPPRMDGVQSNMYDAPEGKDPLAVYSVDENNFQQKIKEEYCFYEKRYFAALDSFLQGIADASLKEGSQNVVESRLKLTRELNMKLTLITQIVNGASKYRYERSHSFQREINSVNEKLKKRKMELDKQNKLLQKENASLEISRSLVNYTTEKNVANNNLLTIYGVLNIVAIAMVLYIART
jgi:hypothetical protein